MISRLGALRITNPDRWRREIASAMRAAQGRVADAAEELGVSKRQLMRWLAELPDVERAVPGRPRGTTVEPRGKHPRKAEKRRWRRWESNPAGGARGFAALRDSAQM